jgi:hypothetical protein
MFFFLSYFVIYRILFVVMGSFALLFLNFGFILFLSKYKMDVSFLFSFLLLHVSIFLPLLFLHYDSYNYGFEVI